MSEIGHCTDCKFWAGTTHGNQFSAECRAHPPAYTTVKNTVWPHTQAGDWCGEFQPKDNTSVGREQ